MWSRFNGGGFTVRADGEKLVKLREARRYLQREIEDGAGIPRGHLTRLETGKSDRLEYLGALADFYGEDVRNLLSEESKAFTLKLLSKLAELHEVPVSLDEQAQEQTQVA